MLRESFFPNFSLQSILLFQGYVSGSITLVLQLLASEITQFKTLSFIVLFSVRLCLGDGWLGSFMILCKIVLVW